MNKVFKFICLGLIFCQISFASDERRVSSGNGGMRGNSAPRTTSNRVFPSYPQRSSVNGHMSNIPTHSDSFGNRVTSDHLNRVEFAHGRSEAVMRGDVQVRESVYRGSSNFVLHYRPGIEVRTNFINNYFVHYPVVIRPEFASFWHANLFYGGFYWGFHPILNIETYFYNPMVYWMFVPTYDEYYYRSWYASEYDANPTLHYPFIYHGLYYPTDNLRQLLVGVSAMPVDKQVQFRAAITTFTKKIAQTLANQLNQHIRLSDGDIVITHYEIEGYDEAVELEGFVGFVGQEYQLKGLLDLQDPQRTSVFIPQDLNVEPQPAQIQSLTQINEQVQDIQGNSTLNAPVEPEIPATPAEVTADPMGK